MADVAPQCCSQPGCHEFRLHSAALFVFPVPQSAPMDRPSSLKHCLRFCTSSETPTEVQLDGSAVVDMVLTSDTWVLPSNVLVLSCAPHLSSTHGCSSSFIFTLSAICSAVLFVVYSNQQPGVQFHLGGSTSPSTSRCQTCKDRRVYSDEFHPECRNITKRGVRYAYKHNSNIQQQQLLRSRFSGPIRPTARLRAGKGISFTII